jgi:hypothetical protein
MGLPFREAPLSRPDVFRIEVSGTAAIDEKGVSLYPDDIRAQITATFDRIEALIGQEGARIEDICAATVFMKRPEYYAVYREMAGTGLRFLGLQADAEELLEIDAWPSGAPEVGCKGLKMFASCARSG